MSVFGVWNEKKGRWKYIFTQIKSVLKDRIKFKEVILELLHSIWRIIFVSSSTCVLYRKKALNP